MKKFLHWGQVQQQLREHAIQTGTCYSFYDAVHDLWKAGAFFEAEDVPLVSFEDWNVDDLDELERLLDCTPVKLSDFFHNFQSELPALTAVRLALKLESAPIRIAAYQAMGLHTISSMELFYVARGQAQLRMEGTTRTLPEHSFSILPPNLVRDVTAGPETLLISIALTEQAVEETLYKLLQRDNILSEFFRSGMGGSPSYLIFQLEHPRPVLSALRGILHECYTRGEYSKRIYLSYLEILFAMLLRQSDSDQYRHSSRQQGALPILAVLKYIQDHFKTTTLQEAAEQFHYEPSYLGKQIRLATGRNYTEIIRTLRLEEAKRLLRNTDLSVNEVALSAGFGSRVNFFRCFRAALGTTPGEYRAEKDLIL